MMQLMTGEEQENDRKGREISDPARECHASCPERKEKVTVGSHLKKRSKVASIFPAHNRQRKNDLAVTGGSAGEGPGPRPAMEQREATRG